MGFEKFGRFGYVSQTKINPLLSYLEKGQIAATRCKKCGRTYFPPRAECLDDRQSTVEWVVLDGKTSLITFTKVFFAPPAFQPETPYLLGLAELSNGLRIFAPISPYLDSMKPQAIRWKFVRDCRQLSNAYLSLDCALITWTRPESMPNSKWV